MANNDEETFWVLEENDAFMARRCLGEISDSKREKEKDGVGRLCGWRNLLIGGLLLQILCRAVAANVLRRGVPLTNACPVLDVSWDEY